MRNMQKLFPLVVVCLLLDDRSPSGTTFHGLSVFAIENRFKLNSPREFSEQTTPPLDSENVGTFVRLPDDVKIAMEQASGLDASMIKRLLGQESMFPSSDLSISTKLDEMSNNVDTHPKGIFIHNDNINKDLSRRRTSLDDQRLFHHHTLEDLEEEESPSLINDARNLSLDTHHVHNSMNVSTSTVILDWPRLVWQSHIYLSIIAFSILAVYVSVNVIRLQFYWNKIKPTDVKMSNDITRFFGISNIFVVMMCGVRIVYLVYDPYNMNVKLSRHLSYFLHDISSPALVSSFSFLFFALLKATQVELLSHSLQSTSTPLVIFTILHFALICIVDSVVGLSTEFRYFVLIIQASFIILMLLLAAGYFYTFSTLKQVSTLLIGRGLSNITANQRSINVGIGNNVNDGTGTTGSSSGGGNSESIALQKQRNVNEIMCNVDQNLYHWIRRSVCLTLVVAILGSLMGGAELFGMIKMLGLQFKDLSIFHNKSAWYVYQICKRLMELITGFLIANITSPPSKSYSDASMSLCCCFCYKESSAAAGKRSDDDVACLQHPSNMTNGSTNRFYSEIVVDEHGNQYYAVPASLLNTQIQTVQMPTQNASSVMTGGGVPQGHVLGTMYSPSTCAVINEQCTQNSMVYKNVSFSSNHNYGVDNHFQNCHQNQQQQPLFMTASNNVVIPAADGSSIMVPSSPRLAMRPFNQSSHNSQQDHPCNSASESMYSQINLMELQDYSPATTTHHANPTIPSSYGLSGSGNTDRSSPSSLLLYDDNGFIRIRGMDEKNGSTGSSNHAKVKTSSSQTSTLRLKSGSSCLVGGGGNLLLPTTTAPNLISIDGKLRSSQSFDNSLMEHQMAQPTYKMNSHATLDNRNREVNNASQQRCGNLIFTSNDSSSTTTASGGGGQGETLDRKLRNNSSSRRTKNKVTRRKSGAKENLEDRIYEVVSNHHEKTHSTPVSTNTSSQHHVAMLHLKRCNGGRKEQLLSSSNKSSSVRPSSRCSSVSASQSFDMRIYDHQSGGGDERKKPLPLPRNFIPQNQTLDNPYYYCASSVIHSSRNTGHDTSETMRETALPSSISKSNALPLLPSQQCSGSRGAHGLGPQTAISFSPPKSSSLGGYYNNCGEGGVPQGGVMGHHYLVSPLSARKVVKNGALREDSTSDEVSETSYENSESELENVNECSEKVNSCSVDEGPSFKWDGSQFTSEI